MSKLEQLIEELCPDGVKYKILGEVCELITKGTTPKSYVTNGIAFIKTESFLNDKIDKEKIMYVDDDTHNNFLKRSILKENDILFAIAGSIGKCVIVEKAILPANTNQALAIIRLKNIVNLRYVYHILKSNSMQHYIEKSVKGSAQPNLNLQQINNFPIPLPPLSIQEEIVRILDNFTEFTAELTAELTARKKQYEYYRDSLLTFGDEVEWKTLGTTCDMKSGKTIKAVLIAAEKNDENRYECYGGNGSRGYVTNFSHDGEFPIIGRQGALCGNINYAEGQFYATEHAVVVNGKQSYIQKFLFYMLKSMNLNQYKSQGAQPGLAVGNIENLLAPLPPLAEQQRIVDILDRFDTLCNDISTGLPAEIEARKKQYEYYRDKLLTFKELP